MKTGEDELLEGARPGLPSNQLLLAGMLAMQLEARPGDTDKGERRRPEVILLDLGMTIGQIASLTGRNYETVKSAIRRSRARQVASGSSTKRSDRKTDG